MKIGLKDAFGKASRVVIELVKEEARSYIHDVTKNTVELIIMPKLKDWRWKFWELMVNLLGKIYIIPTYRKLIRMERELNLPHAGPLQHNEDFRYGRPEKIFGY